MKFLHQFLLIMLFSFLGELLHRLIPLPIPASIYGMVLVFAALSLKIIKPQAVRDAGSFLVSILPVLFVAPIVSLMDCWDIIRPHLIPIVVILIVSTFLCFAVCGWTAQFFIKKKQEGKNND